MIPDVTNRLDFPYLPIPYSSWKHPLAHSSLFSLRASTSVCLPLYSSNLKRLCTAFLMSKNSSGDKPCPRSCFASSWVFLSKAFLALLSRCLYSTFLLSVMFSVSAVGPLPLALGAAIPIALYVVYRVEINHTNTQDYARTCKIPSDPQRTFRSPGGEGDYHQEGLRLEGEGSMLSGVHFPSFGKKESRYLA